MYCSLKITHHSYYSFTLYGRVMTIQEWPQFKSIVYFCQQFLAAWTWMSVYETLDRYWTVKCDTHMIFNYGSS